MTEEEQIREALLLLEEPRPLSRGETDAIFARMVEELERETAIERGAAPAARRRRFPWMRARPAIAFALAMALLVGAAVVLLIPRAPSALAVLEEARGKFKELPAYHAKTFVNADDDVTSPGFELRYETEDWYSSRTKFRSVITASNGAFIGVPGSFRVSDGTLLGDYRADNNIFTATPLDEFDGPVDPAGFFNPSLQWWGSGTGEAKPSDQFFEENCNATPGEYVGRKATRLLCPAEPRQIDLWVDDETGMLLRIDVFDVIREIRSIEFRPQFPGGTFEVKAPDGAKKRWGGRGTPPSEYAVTIGSEVAARHRVLTDAFEGFEIIEVGAGSVWASVSRRGAGPEGTVYSNELVRLNPRTGKVIASVKPPTPTFIQDALVVGRHLWISFQNNAHRDGGPSGWLQRLDLGTNKLVEPQIEMAATPGGLAVADGFLWTTGGKSRKVVQGRGEADFRSVVRISLSTFEVTTMDLEGGAGSGIIYHAGHIWVGEERFIPSGNDTEYFIDKIDPVAMKVGATIPFPNYPAGVPLVAADKYIYTVSADKSNEFSVLRIDPESGKIVSAPGVAEGGTLAFAGGYLWQMSYLGNEVVKYDPVTLQVTGRIATGETPFGLGAGLGSIWVTHRDGTLARIDVE